jgi:2-oxoisovalerate dehydrogenase E1 component subunit alpha
MDAHTNADDATRYRDDEEVERWSAADPLSRLEAHLRARGALTDEDVAAVREEAEALAAELRAGMNAETVPDPLELFDHVYAEPTPQLREQRALLAAELSEADEPTTFQTQED